MNPNNRFPENFRSFIEALNQHTVEYLLIGGFAMGAYGHIRSTGDLDIFIHTTNENAQRAIKACIDFGIDEADLTRDPRNNPLPAVLLTEMVFSKLQRDRLV